MSISTNQLQQLTSVLGTDSVLLDSAAGTGRLSLDGLGRYIAEKENLRYGVNLLDNARWTVRDAIINQRGQTEYTSMNYTIDRWYMGGNITLVKLLNTGIEVTGTGGQFFQKIESYFMEFLWGRTITISVIANDTLYTGTQTLPKQRPSVSTNYANVFMPGVLAYLRIYPDNNANSIFAFQCNNINQPLNIKAAKLELGSHQTLAHQDASGNLALNDPPPNKALELAKCQRYLYVYPGTFYRVGWINSTASSIHIPLPEIHCMRTIPTVITDIKTIIPYLAIDCNGKRIFPLLFLCKNTGIIAFHQFRPFCSPPEAATAKHDAITSDLSVRK